MPNIEDPTRRLEAFKRVHGEVPELARTDLELVVMNSNEAGPGYSKFITRGNKFGEQVEYFRDPDDGMRALGSTFMRRRFVEPGNPVILRRAELVWQQPSDEGKLVLFAEAMSPYNEETMKSRGLSHPDIPNALEFARLDNQGNRLAAAKYEDITGFTPSLNLHTPGVGVNLVKSIAGHVWYLYINDSDQRKAIELDRENGYRETRYVAGAHLAVKAEREAERDTYSVELRGGPSLVVPQILDRRLAVGALAGHFEQAADYIKSFDFKYTPGK